MLRYRKRMTYERSLNRVFLINADNVCIKNLNFINSRTTGLAGGVISWWGNNGTLSNCNFENNSASSGGGAVLWNGNDGCIESCNFINNNVSYGPAVSLTSGESFDPHQIHIQVVNSEGGALYVNGYNPIVIWEMNRLICEPTCSELGYFSRHIYVLFEDIASMLSKCGVHLSLDGFTWDAAKVHPFRKSQQPQYYTTGRQGVV